jgi:probable phosphoglycerate mutase
VIIKKLLTSLLVTKRKAKKRLKKDDEKMTTRIIIARHGNTFSKGQTPTRVGGRTDLPLVEENLGKMIGKYLKENDLIPQIVWAAPLKRTMQTAMLATKEMGLDFSPIADDSFVEIDYGPDENKTEDETMLRLGKCYLEKDGVDFSELSDEEIIKRGDEVIKIWNSDAVVPEGWNVDPNEIIESWNSLGEKVKKEFEGKTVMVVTSNGIARFAPHLTGDFDAFAKENPLKIATGALCIFEKEDDEQNYKCTAWNLRPKNFVTL